MADKIYKYKKANKPTIIVIFRLFEKLKRVYVTVQEGGSFKERTWINPDEVDKHLTLLNHKYSSQGYKLEN